MQVQVNVTVAPTVQYMYTATIQPVTHFDSKLCDIKCHILVNGVIAQTMPVNVTGGDWPYIGSCANYAQAQEQLAGVICAYCRLLAQCGMDVILAVEAIAKIKR